MTLTLPQPFTFASPQCESCAFSTGCGGLDFGTSLFGCLTRCCGNKQCDEVCPSKPDFFDRLAEVRFLDFSTLKSVNQKSLHLPSFIPHVPHRYSRYSVLPTRWVSLSPYQLLRLPNKRCEISIKDGVKLREIYKLAPDAQIIFRGSDEDSFLEQYWAYRRRDGLAEQFKALGGAIFIGPNFSHFGDVVRTDNLFNRMRQLICLEEMSEAGLNVAPHLNDSVSADWMFWADYLRDNPTVNLVAKEFQTRCRKWSEGRLAVDRLADLQQRVGRELHPIIVGGAQYVEILSPRFTSFTIIDCRPMQDGLHYYRTVPKGRRCRREQDQRLPYTGPDEIINENIRVFGRWIEHRARYSSTAHLSGRRVG